MSKMQGSAQATQTSLLLQQQNAGSNLTSANVGSEWALFPEAIKGQSKTTF